MIQQQKVHPILTLFYFQKDYARNINYEDSLFPSG